MSTTVATREYIRVLGGTLERLERPASAPFQVPTEPAVIGRAPECGLVLHDAKVSSAHVEVTATARGTRIRDLGSRNGTFVDGHECTEVYLRRPARLQCGDTILQFLPAAPVDVETGMADVCGALVGTATVMRRLFHRIRKIAPTDLTVLVTGETGTGKELVAKAIHEGSARAAGPFVTFDCGSVPASLAESELFGHERGAFTGATDRRRSPFLHADGGTILLDEIGELPLELQPKLLRALQERCVKPVGASTYQPFNARIVAATRRDLGRETNTGGFRDDLFFRLNGLQIEVPPLRDRREDVAILIRHFARELGFRDAAHRVSVESIARLSAYDWPGNVRELRNVVAAGLALANESGPIDLEEHLSPESRRVSRFRRQMLFKSAMADFEGAYWKEVVLACEGNISEMHRVTGLARSTIRDYLTKYELRGTD